MTLAARASMPVPTSPLTGLGPDRREAFELRVERWYDDIESGLAEVYGEAAAPALADELVALAAGAYAARDPELHRLDARRLLEPDWLQSPRMFGYAAYADRFAGDLAGVADRVAYLHDLGVTYLHLMPLLHPREGDNDGGYAVQDYRSVRPDLGTVADLRRLATTLRDNGISLVLDLVLNHVAREHDWAVRARAGDPAYRQYFYVFPDRAVPDAYEQSLPEVFPDFAPGSFTWDEDLAGWVWTTFNEWQWDVNWANPAVLREYVEIILFLANLGVEVVRLDAIAFMWKRLGTSCQNQPEVHPLTQVLRAVARIACPALAFKAEAIVGPRDLVQYLGLGAQAGKVSDLAYHNSLMVQIWSMLATGETALAAHALRALPPTPSTGTWICYIRCHDDIGWAIDDGDAAAVGLGGWAHRSFLADWYSGAFPGSPARGLVFQANEQTGDRRISGTAASLCGLESARTPAEIDTALARIHLAHAVIAGWGGIPVLWSGDELGLTNDPRWAAEPGHEDDNRWAHRPRLDPARAALRDDLTTVEARVFHALAHLARVRRSLPQLRAGAPTTVLEPLDPGVLAVHRHHASGVFLGLYNVTSQWRPWPVGAARDLGLADPFDALSGHHVDAGADGLLWIGPYSASWLVEVRSPRG